MNGRSVLYISHVLEVVEQVCDRVVVLGKGRVLANASPAELKRTMEHSSLESVFTELVEQTDTRSTARELVSSMEAMHAQRPLAQYEDEGTGGSRHSSRCRSRRHGCNLSLRCWCGIYTTDSSTTVSSAKMRRHESPS